MLWKWSKLIWEVEVGKLCVTYCLKEWWTASRVTAPLSKVSLSYVWKEIKMILLNLGSCSRYIFFHYTTQPYSLHCATQCPQPVLIWGPSGFNDVKDERNTSKGFSAENCRYKSLKIETFLSLRHYTVNQMLLTFHGSCGIFWINQCLEIKSYISEDHNFRINIPAEWLKVVYRTSKMNVTVHELCVLSNLHTWWKAL